MLNGKFLLCVVLVAAWNEVQPASLPFLPARIGDANEIGEAPDVAVPVELMRARVREGVPPPLCAGRCFSPPAGPVCAFDATGTARTFATLCDLEAASCRESTYYAIASRGEC
uniref:Kazal-like domain-containing protein n=1 Tax=Heliothis virescens TaxID=7102 RepID=A0A2A4JJW6_HELVI